LREGTADRPLDCFENIAEAMEAYFPLGRMDVDIHGSRV